MDEWQPPLPEGYNHANRAFLQALMSRGTMTLADGQQIIAAILGAGAGGSRNPVDPASVTQGDLDEYIHAAREALAPLDYDIRRTQHQKTKEWVYALINVHSDPATQLATTHTPDEISFIKRLLDAMFDTYNTPRMEVLAVDESQALKVSRPSRAGRESNVGANGASGEDSQSAAKDRGLRHSEVLTLLKSLVAEGWLEKSRDGFYSLSTRSLLELWPWLMATYNDADSEDDWQRIKFCEGCKEIVTVGQRCVDRDCVARIHDICHDQVWPSRTNKKCPKCEKPWDGNRFVGERAVTSTKAYQKGRSRGSGRRSNLTEAIIAQEEAGGEDEGEMEA